MSIKSALIGYTGFVGSNLIECFNFDKKYNTKNIHEIDGQDFDLVVCAGVSAVKWLANQEPQTDIANIDKLKQHLCKVRAKRLVLISTIDVYDTPLQVDEDAIPDISKQDYYGKHRYQLEQWVAAQPTIYSYTIMRLPGLFGKNLKKNLIFDILNPLAACINKPLWETLKAKLDLQAIAEVESAYSEDELGNLRIRPEIMPKLRERLIQIFAKLDFSSLNFTDSRSSFQFYNLANLWSDIDKAIQFKAPILNLSSAPITAQELVKFVTGKVFTNNTAKGGAAYDMYSKYAKDGKYLYDKLETLKQIKNFIENYR